MLKLGVNIDHVATLRQARGTVYPNVIEAAHAAIRAGADQITVHLREDRRHIQDTDVRDLKSLISVPLNLEMAATDEMVVIASDLRPDRVTLVPERREELTTEGGLDVTQDAPRFQTVISQLRGQQIEVSLFIDPDEPQIAAAKELGAGAIELHTGCYADATDATKQAAERERLKLAAYFATERGLFTAAGHGLHLENIADLVTIPEIREYNIGHSIVARAVFVGLEEAVREMKAKLSCCQS